MTSGLSSVTAQDLTTSYQTIFEAKPPSGSAGTDGPPVRIFRFKADTDTATVKLTRGGGGFGSAGAVTEHPIAVDEVVEFAAIPNGFIKAEAKGASANTNLTWDPTLI